jgi:hypothetical protein
MAYEEEDDPRKNTKILELRIIFRAASCDFVDRFWFLSANQEVLGRPNTVS